MRSPRRSIIEELYRLTDPTKRLTNMTARFRVYRRDPIDVLYGAEWLSDIYGGIWDDWSQDYLDDPGEVLQLKCHPGTLKAIEGFDLVDVRRHLILGGPGSGKTEILVAILLTMALWFPGKPFGAFAPNLGRVGVLRRKLLRILPASWIAEQKDDNKERWIKLVNGSVIYFFGTQRSKKQGGFSFAGFELWGAIEDESQDMPQDALDEIDARMRTNPKAQIYSSATNAAYGYFQRRVKEYQLNKLCRIIRLSGPENTFLAKAHWEALKGLWSTDNYNRTVMAQDVAISGKVYPAFTLDNVRQKPSKPQVGQDPDITYQLTKSVLNEDHGFLYVVGTDFGVRTNASVIMKCYRQVSGLTLGPNANVDGWDRQWFVLGEVITEKSSDHHASDLLAWFAQRGNTAADFICITGQDSNSVQPDKNHHVNFKNRGINVIKANNGKVLTVPWRYAMVNACLETANRTRHLFIDCDDKGRSSAPKTFDSFEQLMLNSSDRAESHGKGSHGEDLTHFTDNVGYALWRFERHRGAPITEQARALWG